MLMMAACFAVVSLSNITSCSGCAGNSYDGCAASLFPLLTLPLPHDIAPLSFSLLGLYHYLPPKLRKDPNKGVFASALNFRFL